MWNTTVTGRVFGCAGVWASLVYACVSMRIITERRQTRRQKMNMLYGGSKILHGPSAREEPRAECLRLPNIINYLPHIYLCCVWPITSLRSATGSGVAALLMNTNYTFVSLLLNVSWLFSAQLAAGVESADGWFYAADSVFWYARSPSVRFKVNTVHAEKQTNVFGKLCTDRGKVDIVKTHW